MQNNQSSKIIEPFTINFKEFSQKYLKLFNFIYNQNLEHFIKNNQYLLEDIQFPQKIRLRKQQDNYVNSNRKAIVQDNIDKMIKQNLDKNNSIAKGIKQYYILMGKQKLTQQLINDQNQITLQKHAKSIKKDYLNLTMNNFNSFQISLDNNSSLVQKKFRGKTFSNTKMHRRLPNKTNSQFKIQNNYNFQTIDKQNKKTQMQRSISFRKQFKQNKIRNRNFSLHTDMSEFQVETIQYQNQFSNSPDKFNIYQSQIQNDQAHQTFYDCSMNSFVPFCGLNKNSTLFKKRTLKDYKPYNKSLTCDGTLKHNSPLPQNSNSSNAFNPNTTNAFNLTYFNKSPKILNQTLYDNQKTQKSLQKYQHYLNINRPDNQSSKIIQSKGYLKWKSYLKKNIRSQFVAIKDYKNVKKNSEVKNVAFLIKQNLAKNPSDTIVKTLQRQGYKGRYRSLHRQISK